MRDAKLVVGVSAVSLAYAIVRYNVFKGVSWEQLPVYVTNKAIAVAGLVLLGMSRFVVEIRRRKELGLAGACFTGLHVILSFMLLEPAYFAQHYLPSGMMRWTGEASMLAGAIAATLVGWLVYATSNRPVETQVRGASLVPGVARVVLALVAAHVAALGVSVWLDVGAWPGRLPPITLLSFLLAVGFCVLPRASATKG